MGNKRLPLWLHYLFSEENPRFSCKCSGNSIPSRYTQYSILISTHTYLLYAGCGNRYADFYFLVPAFAYRVRESKAVLYLCKQYPPGQKKYSITRLYMYGVPIFANTHTWLTYMENEAAYFSPFSFFQRWAIG